MDAPRADYKPHVPRIETILIDKDQIGAVIGPGGKVIQEIQKETGTTISITEDENNGIVQIACDNKEGMDKALAWVNGIVAKPEVGSIYQGKVKKHRSIWWRLLKSFQVKKVCSISQKLTGNASRKLKMH